MLHYYHERQLPAGCCRLLFLALLFCLSGVSEAQYTHTLTNTMYSAQTGRALSVAVGADGTVFMIGEGSGLWAYLQADGRFMMKAYQPIPDQPSSLAIGPNGFIYVGSESGALAVFALAGSEFNKITHVQCPHPIYDIATIGYGSIIIAGGTDGLVAYHYNGATFVETNRVNEGGDIRTVAVGNERRVYAASRIEHYISIYSYDRAGFHQEGRLDGSPPMANDLAVNDDGLLFLADLFEGLFMYRFDGATLVPVDQRNEGGSGISVALSEGHLVYLANGDDGMRVYENTGDELLPRAHWTGLRNDARCVAAGSGETVLLANGVDGLRALDCAGPDVLSIAHAPTGDIAFGVAAGWDGTIFVANGADGLVAYRAGYPFLRCTARTNGDGSLPMFARAVTVDGANMVYLAHDKGLSVYAYSEGSFERIAHTALKGIPTGIALDRWGRIYLACGTNGLLVFQMIGIKLYPITQVNDGGNAMDVAVTRTGTVFLANGGDGLRAYAWMGDKLYSTAHINEGGGFVDWARKIALGFDNTIFLAGSQEGLRAYVYDGAVLRPRARLIIPGNNGATGVSALEIGRDGTIFFGCNGAQGTEANGLFACRFDGRQFTITARAAHLDFASDIAVAPDGMVFLADRRGGVLGYEYVRVMEMPMLAVNPLSIDFGEVSVGSSTLRSVMLSNIGTDPLHVYGLQLFSATLYEFSLLNAEPTVIPVGGAIRVWVRFVPWSVGQKEALLRIISNDPEHFQFDIPMRARVASSAVTPIPIFSINLGPNIPNPFNPSTDITYYVSNADHVTLAVFDLAGRRVATLVDAQAEAGWHTVRFDASALPSGIYMYRLESGEKVMTRKMMLMK